jgi:hypothetical protein
LKYSIASHKFGLVIANRSNFKQTFQFTLAASETRSTLYVRTQGCQKATKSNDLRG